METQSQQQDFLAMPPPPNRMRDNNRKKARRVYDSTEKEKRVISSSSEEEEELPTSAVDFLESSHGRERRQQRQIGVRDLQAAVKYGVRQPAGRCRKTRNTRSKFTYNGVVYIVDDVTKQEVTSYNSIRDLQPKLITDLDRSRHKAALERIQNDKASWKSHTIIIVDKSGSMRMSDVRGSRTRLGAVWLSIAEDFIDNRLRTCNAGDQDVVSIILMGQTAQLLIQEWPTGDSLTHSLTNLFFMFNISFLLFHFISHTKLKPILY